MADPKLYPGVCTLCGSEFAHRTRRKTCSDACYTSALEAQRAETELTRRERIKECVECHRTFSWEEIGGAEFQFDKRTCCTLDCFRIHQKKETAARNSIRYHGVRLSIEDVCKLERKSIEMIRRLMKTGSIPGAQWAEPELRAQRPMPKHVKFDDVITVRVTKEYKLRITAYAQARGWTTAGDLMKHLVNDEMQRNPKR